LTIKVGSNTGSSQSKIPALILSTPGVKNEIADAFSRPIPIIEPNEIETLMLSEELTIPDDKYKLTVGYTIPY